MNNLDKWLDNTWAVVALDGNTRYSYEPIKDIFKLKGQI